jgi:hypothetical protein
MGNRGVQISNVDCLTVRKVPVMLLGIHPVHYCCSNLVRLVLHSFIAGSMWIQELSLGW